MEEAKKAREETKQHGYKVGMAETEDALRAEVPGACKLYCAQVCDETLNQARVEASSALRKAENVYYPKAICSLSSNSSKVDIPSEVANPEKNGSEKALPSFGSPPKVAKQLGVNEKEAEVTKGVPADVIKPPAVPEDPTKDNETSKMEIVLVTLPILAKGNLKGTN